MAKDSRIDIPVPKFDDLFKSTIPEEVIKEKVVNLQLKDIVPFPNHPFKVKDTELDEMIESIKSTGVNIPIIVRKKEDGEYELVSGHRRKRACEILGIDEIPCIIRDLTDDEAIIQMVDSNIQREEILPSERAFAFKMKMEALKHQGKRVDLIYDYLECELDEGIKDLTSCQVGTKLDSAEEVAKKNKASRRQVYRYIRLTELIPEFLAMVDDKKFAVNSAVEISYLTKDEQNILLDAIQCALAMPNQEQAKELKQLSREKRFFPDEVEKIIFEEKPNQIPKYKISYDKFKKYIPRQVVTPQEVENYLLKCAIACQQMGIKVEQIKIDVGNTKQKVLQRER